MKRAIFFVIDLIEIVNNFVIRAVKENRFVEVVKLLSFSTEKQN